MNLLLFILLNMVVLLMSCEEAPISDVRLPSNLKVEVSQPDSPPYTVEVIAAADEVNFFRFYFGDDSDFIEQKEGEITYTYPSAGDYQLLVQAHTTSDAFIDYSEHVTISDPDPADLIPDSGYETPESYEGMNLVWSDEFDSNELNISDWTYEIGTGANGWGNNELQYYTDQNISLVDGHLMIWARKEAKGGRDYTSSRIITEGKEHFQYGRVDIRAVLPKGQGIWPALWMLGANFRETGWPSCGEIDIMEMIGGGGRENTIHGTLHWSNSGTYATSGDSYQLSNGIFSDAFHVFSIIWTADAIQWYVDDVMYNELDITEADRSEFRAPFFLLFNVAVGGNWPGDPNASTQFPQFMAVDYVRVFQPN